MPAIQAGGDDTVDGIVGMSLNTCAPGGQIQMARPPVPRQQDLGIGHRHWQHSAQSELSKPSQNSLLCAKLTQSKVALPTDANPVHCLTVTDSQAIYDALPSLHKLALWDGKHNTANSRLFTQS